MLLQNLMLVRSKHVRMRKLIDILIGIWVLVTISVDIGVVVTSATAGVWALDAIIRSVLLIIIVVVGVLDYVDKD